MRFDLGEKCAFMKPNGMTKDHLMRHWTCMKSGEDGITPGWSTRHIGNHRSRTHGMQLLTVSW